MALTAPGAVTGSPLLHWGAVVEVDFGAVQGAAAIVVSVVFDGPHY